MLKDVKNARILVGINVDKITYEALQRGKKINLLNQENFLNNFKQAQEQILQDEEYSKDADISVAELIDLISQNKLKIRISKDENIHSKFYILRENEFKRHDGSIEYKGSVVTRSSNLTENRRLNLCYFDQ